MPREPWYALTANPGQGLRGNIQWFSHQLGRELFASNFAQGGFAATAFASSAGEAMRGMLRPKVRFGGRIHMRRLEALYGATGQEPRVRKAIEKASAGRVKSMSRAGKAARVLGGVGFVGLLAAPALMEEGTPVEKTERLLGELAGGTLGWHAGGTAGAAVGAAIGSVIPGLGTAIGAGIGYIAGGFLGYEGTAAGITAAASVPRRMVERERKRRSMSWATANPAFNTRQAATMRQTSLQAMNRGMMSARSALGQEGFWLHQ